MRGVSQAKTTDPKSRESASIIISVLVLVVGFVGIWAKSPGEHGSRPGRLAAETEKLVDYV